MRKKNPALLHKEGGPKILRFARWKYWLAAVLWAGLIFGLSSVPGERFVDWMAGVPHGDKAVHLVEYAIFGYLLALAAGGKKRNFFPLRLGVLVVVIALLFGGLDEYHQSFVPNREPSVFDLVFDGLGASLGCFLFSRKVKSGA